MNMNVKTISNKASSIVRGDSAKSSGAKFKASCFAIILGLVIGMIPILAMGGNPFSAYVEMFTAPFNENNIQTTWVMIGVFIIMGAGIGVSFKTGLFNIGASGQFLLSGTITLMMSLTMPMDKALAVPLLILVSAVIGAVAASIAGALKAFFNVHEVVSTILLNWIFFYLCKYFLSLETFKSATTDSSKFFPMGSTLSTRPGSFDPILVIIISIVVVSLLAAMFKFTSFGFKLKINGLSEGAATYSGISTKMNTIYSMAISGALAGIAGYIYYSCVQGQIPMLDKDLPSLGFDAITVTLLAFSSPMGSIPAGFFFAVMKSGVQPAGIHAGLSKETMELVLGLIIFLTALAPILVKVKPIEFSWRQWLIYNSTDIKNKKNTLNTTIEEINAKYDKLIADEKNVVALREQKFAEIKLAHDAEIAKIKSDATLSKEQKKEAINQANNIFNVKSIENKTVTLKYLQKTWDDEISFIKKEYKQKRIDIFRRDILIIDTNRRFKEIVENNQLLKLDEIISTKKQSINSAKKDFALFQDSKLMKYAKDVESLREKFSEKEEQVSIELNSKVSELKQSNSSKEEIASLKLNFKQQLAELSNARKSEKEALWATWKEGK